MTTTTNDAAARRAVVGRALLILAALGAAGAAGAGIAQLATAPPEQALTDAWRAFGLVIFAGLFALVAWRPTAYPGVLELAFAHKLALALIAWTQLETADGALLTLILNGLLVLALVVAYVLLGCHRAWRRARPADAAADTPAQRGRIGSRARGEKLEATKQMPSTKDRQRGTGGTTEKRSEERPDAEGQTGPSGIPRPPRP